MSTPTVPSAPTARHGFAARLLAAPERTALLACLIAGVALIGGAFYFQYVEGLAPCALCYQQRWGWYGGIACALFGLGIGLRAEAHGGDARGWYGVFLAGALAGVALTFALALYHVGVEHAWWPGPQGCTGLAVSEGNLLDAITSGPAAVPCDAIPWSLFGISMAGYNALISLGICALMGFGLWRHFRGAGAAS